MNRKNNYVKIRPEKVRLEASTFCQLHCPSCLVGRRKELKIGKGYLKLKDFKKFVGENPFVKSIELSNYGEIFLNPELGPISKYAYEKKIELTAENGVNLNTIDEEVCEILVKYKFKSILCSIDGASQDIYKIYRIGGNFGKVIENIERINSYKKSYHSKFPLLH